MTVRAVRDLIYSFIKFSFSNSATAACRASRCLPISLRFPFVALKMQQLIMTWHFMPWLCRPSSEDERAEGAKTNVLDCWVVVL